MKVCLLLGGSGYLGSNLQRILRNDYSLRIFTSDSEATSSGSEGFEIVAGDFRTIESFGPLLEDVELVVHLISTTVPVEGTEGAEAEVRDNVLPTIRLLEELKKRPGVRLIFLSSGGTVYGNHGSGSWGELAPRAPISSYGMQKLVIEEYLEFYHRVHGVDYLCLRISNPYGTGQKSNRNQGLIPILIERILQGEDIQIWGDGENVRDYLHMEDLLSAFSAVKDYRGTHRVFNIGAGVGHSINAVVSIVIKELGKPDVQIDYRPSRTCDVDWNVLDPGLLMKETGWVPHYDIVSGIRDVIQSLQRRKKSEAARPNCRSSDGDMS